ncbi:MAG TPA: hypothetical protein VD971_12720 [Phycisphaerales bacterium]|nr:hypothetical protein [Phycisphaerales bacterium]
MGTWEDRFAGVGRWIDERLWKMRSGSAADGISSLRDNMSERVRAASSAAADRIDQVRNTHIDREDPRTKRVVLVVALLLVATAGVFAGIYFGGGGGTGLTKEDVAALKRFESKADSSNAVFGTAPPPPPEQLKQQAQPGRTPGSLIPGGR